MLLAADNKLLIVKLGGLEPLIRQMLSPNVEVQCNAVGCVTNLATHGRLHLCTLCSSLLISRPASTDDNKTKIAKSGALVPLTRLARSKDMRVQRNATGALLNMTHSGTLFVPSCRCNLSYSANRREPAATGQCRSYSCARQPFEFTRYRRAILLYHCS